MLKVHRLAGLIAGVYALVISITGAALVFRIDLQRALHPQLFTAAAGTTADPVAIMEAVSRAYPDHALSGVDAPTTLRPTYLAYVTSSRGFKTVLIDPVTARVLGELPERTAVRTLQELHFDLLSGRTGRIVNGIGALAIILLAVTGVVEWWRRPARWQPGRYLRESHRAAGIAGAAFILMWAITGAYFAFPSAFRAMIGAVSPLTVSRTPESAVIDTPTPPAWRDVIASARKQRPDAHIARVVLPFGERGSWLVMFAASQPTPAYTGLDSVFIDRYSGAVIDSAGQRASAGDRITRLMTPLHVGAFGGAPVRLVWFVFGLVPALLAMSGALVWWQRRGAR